MKRQRLVKILARTGVAARRSCEEIILARRVTLVGEVVDDPAMLLDSSEGLKLDGKPLPEPERRVTYLLHKPIGYVCSTRATPKLRPVLDLFKGVTSRLFTIGRLDGDTSGLLLVTNDGELAQRVIHPSSCIEKEYVTETNLPLNQQHLASMARGIRIEGVLVKPLSVKKLENRLISIVVGEGKKHEVRLLLRAAGLRARALMRVRIGNLCLGKLRVGDYRRLSHEDVNLLFSDT